MTIEVKDDTAKRLIIYSKATKTSVSLLASDFIDKYFSSDQIVADTVLAYFSSIKSIQRIYLQSNNVVILLDDPEPLDRCAVYDAQEKLAKTLPDKSFVFYTTDSDANYSAYRVIYERK